MKIAINCILITLLCLKFSYCQDYDEIARYGVKQLTSVRMLDMNKSGSKVMYLARHKKYKYSIWMNDSMIAANSDRINVLYTLIDSAIVFYRTKDQ